MSPTSSECGREDVHEPHPGCSGLPNRPLTPAEYDAMAAAAPPPETAKTCYRCGASVPAGDPNARRLRVSQAPLVQVDAEPGVIAFSRRVRYGVFCAGCMAEAPDDPAGRRQWALRVGASKLVGSA